MEEINLKDILYYFKKNCFIIIELVLLAIIVAEVYIGFFEKTLYKSDTTILVYNEQTEHVTTNEITLNNQLVKTYSQIIKSRKVLSKVIRELSLNYNISQLSSMITVSSVNDTQIIRITVVNEDNKKAKQIANTLARIFSEEVAEIYKLDNVSIVDEAIIAKEPFNINGIKTLIIAVILGIALGSAIVFVKYYFDDTIKTIEEVEKSLNLPIMGVVPKYNIKSKESRGYNVRRINRKK